MRGSDISAECKSVDIRASNTDRPCTHRQCLDHIGPRTHAGIEQDWSVAGCGYYRRQHVNCCNSSIRLTSAMIGTVDPIRPGINRTTRIVWMAYAFQNQRQLCY